MKLVDEDNERNNDLILLSDLIIDQFIRSKRDIASLSTSESKLVYNELTKDE